MGFFSHDDSDEQQAYEQVQREGSTCKLSASLAALWSKVIADSRSFGPQRTKL